MIKLLRTLSVVVGFCLVSSVGAEVPKATDTKIRESFKKSLPSLQIDNINSSPIASIYEVTSGPIIMYVTEDGKFAISGDILDLQDGETNITEESRKKARLAAIEKIGKEHMIIFPAKKQRFEVTVFTDLDCVYCRKFHAQIQDINNRGITVRYLAFPRAGEKSTSFEKAVNVWCSDNPQDMLTKAKQGQPVPIKQCDTHQIQDQFHLGVMSGISGTPSMILDDGTLVGGYYDADNLLNILKSVHGDPVAKKKITPKDS